MLYAVYSSGISQMCEVNRSFDSGILRVAYTGKNRNGSSISKEAFERSIETIYNCPIVCNYNRDSDSIGSHDIELVRDSDGSLYMVNVTDPVGVVPESAKYYWEIVEEEDGSEHEYLCVEVLLWKRQEAYRKIKEDGVVAESMEITVKNGRSIDGVFVIEDFEFTAFCLLGSAEPCFESASLVSFSRTDLKQQIADMMCELKQVYSTVTTSQEDDINILSKGGRVSLNKTELLLKYGLMASDLDFDIDDYSCEELEAKFEEMKRPSGEVAATEEDNVDPEGDSPESEGDDNSSEGEATEGEGEEPDDSATGDENTPAEDDATGEESGDDTDVEDGDSPGEPTETFSLTGEQTVEALVDVLHTVTYSDPVWGECCRYVYWDYSITDMEVYCYDWTDWKLYGFLFSFNGDNVVIDFESKKRKKISIVDFDNGDSESVATSVFANFANALYESRSKKEAEKSELFAKFSELNGVEAFEELKANSTTMSLSEIESKCFEIKGRTITANFSFENEKPVRISVEKESYAASQPDALDDEPYGGLFKIYSART